MSEVIVGQELVNNTDKLIFWVAHNPSLLFGTLVPGGNLSTGQKILESFDRELPWRGRVIELGGTFE